MKILSPSRINYDDHTDCQSVPLTLCQNPASASTRTVKSLGIGYNQHPNQAGRQVVKLCDLQTTEQLKSLKRKLKVKFACPVFCLGLMRAGFRLTGGDGQHDGPRLSLKCGPSFWSQMTCR